MNNRIAELVGAEMAQYYEGVYHDSACAKDQLAGFAELIVRECAEWIKATDSDADIGKDDALALLNHFGVSDD